MFKGYVTVEIAGEMETMPPVKLKDPQEVWNYVNLQKRMFPEVIIVDEDDFTVVHAQKGKVIFPQEWTDLENKHFTSQNEYECRICGSRLIEDKKCLTCDSTNLKRL